MIAGLVLWCVASGATGSAGAAVASRRPTIEAEAEAVMIRTIDKGAQSNIDSARQAVARTPAEWQALWQAHAFDRQLPPVDFSREMIVGVFLGSRPTAGFAVEIVGAEARGDSLVVRYRETAPPRDAVTAQILTSPFHLVAAPRASGAVTFEKIER
jgi:protease stability complex PrcB-like protein